ncbi:A-kinase anchor protein 17A [Scleropages formosus]|uniref:A-kinase anchor protein 17A n=1 Tax=Scleropages formosus TaxID=113540 RepID=UPI0010FA699E|nr:A-kinase anchor protein 17A [Scleropages formosus]
MTTTIVHDTTEAVKLCPVHGLHLKPIAKMMVSVALPQLKQPGKSISNWEVMERLKAMVHPDQFSALRISRSTMEFIRFEGEVENKGMVKTFLAKLDGKSIKLSGFTDILKIRAAETKTDFPTRHDWDSFFRDVKDMNETLPGERPDTIHLEGLPCKWFTKKESSADRPSEDVLRAVFEGFGKIRNVDIPMLDPYREEMMDKNFHTFTFGGHLNFEAYVQYEEYAGFVKAMDALRGMKLMYKGEDGKALACNIKVTFDTTKHLSDASLKKRQLERQKLQELERQREEQKRREKLEEERRKEEERKQREQEEEERERKREEKQRKREQRNREREEKRTQKKAKKQQVEEQKKLHLKIAMEERKLLLTQRNLESIRLIAELLSRAKALKQQQQEKEQAELARKKEAELARKKEAEIARLQQLEERRRLQEAELRRVEEEKARALELQRKERELRERLLSNLLKKTTAPGSQDVEPGLAEVPDLVKASLPLEVYSSETQVQVNGLTCKAGENKSSALSGKHVSSASRHLEKEPERSLSRGRSPSQHGRHWHGSSAQRRRGSSPYDRECSQDRRERSLSERELSREDERHRRRERSDDDCRRRRERSRDRKDRSRSRRDRSWGRRDRSRGRRQHSHERKRYRSRGRSSSSHRGRGRSRSSSSDGRRYSQERERRYRNSRSMSRGRGKRDRHRHRS